MSDPVLKAKVGAPEIASRVASLGWQQIRSDLDAHGSAIAEFVLTPSECQGLASTYDPDELFRSRIVMARHGFGRGEYKYWAYPLPETVACLREALYPHLSGVANRWHKIMDIATTEASG
jgi:hypothetical protein